MNENHELNYFQQKVFEEYELIKSLDKTHRLMQKDGDKKRGCLSAPFAMLAHLREQSGLSEKLSAVRIETVNAAGENLAIDMQDISGFYHSRDLF